MSDWIDLQLAHSLGPVKAPEDLWSRIESAHTRSGPVRRNTASTMTLGRWAVPVAIAACVMVLLARPTREKQFELTSSDPARLQRWLAHEAGIAVPLRPTEGVRIERARLVRKGVVEVSYQVDGASATAVIACGRGDSRCRIPGHTITVASAKSDAACRLCHSL